MGDRANSRGRDRCLDEIAFEEPSVGRQGSRSVFSPAKGGAGRCSNMVPEAAEIPAGGLQEYAYYESEHGGVNYSF